MSSENVILKHFIGNSSVESKMSIVFNLEYKGNTFIFNGQIYLNLLTQSIIMSTIFFCVFRGTDIPLKFSIIVPNMIKQISITPMIKLQMMFE